MYKDIIWVKLDNKKQCIWGADNCSGLIGEKPTKDEKKVREDKNKKVNLEKNKIKNQKKAIKSNSPSPVPPMVSLSSVSTSPETASPCADAGSGAKIWEAFCYRCGRRGTCSSVTAAPQPLSQGLPPHLCGQRCLAHG